MPSGKSTTQLVSAEDKQAIAQRITSIYRAIPKFYVGVVFQEVPEYSFFVGGEPADDCVRIWVDHIARTFNDEEIKARFLNACSQLLSPFISDRGFRWEIHVDETPFSLWSIHSSCRESRKRDGRALSKIGQRLDSPSLN